MFDSTHHWTRSKSGELSLVYTHTGYGTPCRSCYSHIFGPRAERIQAGLIEMQAPGVDMRSMTEPDAIEFAFAGPMCSDDHRPADEPRDGCGLFGLGYGPMSRAPLPVWLDIAKRLGATVYP